MSSDSPERWRRIAALFDEAARLPPERRSEFLRAACEGDADLKRRVTELLEASGQAAGFLEHPVVSNAAEVVRRLAEDPLHVPEPSQDHDLSSSPTRSLAPSSEVKDVIGPYRLLQKIGEGGMGEVWRAEQGEPIRREVALKVIKAGMDTRQVIARFEAERQALALMDHPSIAKVYEAGETPRNLPFFAMEYVPGEAITLYCDRHRLSTRERLDLFGQVCEGVQHAHQKGIIHRDLKPSNILVTVSGGKPLAKIIDFGVAKATAQRLTERTLFTELGVLIGTPEYMSPEQAEMTGLDVDTRTDVYALGVILYELLTGALPFDPKELRRAGFEEIRRRIREVDPPRPSTRVKSLGAKSTEAASRRRTEPRKLVSRLKGDLDWIVMKALEKDRTRRYGSPAELAADIQRHLRVEPVVAGPPGAGYRAGKFVRRHRFGVAAASVALLGLVAFGVTMAVQARRIAKERNRAEKVSQFLTDLFRVSDPGQARGNSVTAREILDKGAERIEKELSSEPEVQAQLMGTMGYVYTNLGLYDKAEPLFAKSVETRRRILGEEDPATLASMEGLAFVYERQGRYPEAEKLDHVTVEKRRRILGEEHPDTLFSMERLAVVIEREGRYQEALDLQLKVLEARRRALPENDQATIWSIQNVAADYEWLGRYKEAEPLFRQAYELRKRILGADHPFTLWVMSNLGRLENKMGRYDEAERLLREAYESRQRVLGPEHQDTLGTLGDLCGTYEHKGLFKEEEKCLRKAFEGMRRAMGEDYPSTLVLKDSLAGSLVALGRLAEAKAIYLEVLESRRRLLGPENPRTMATTNNLANVFSEEKNYREAEKMYRQVLEVDRRVLGPDAVNTLYALLNLGSVCAEQKRADEAEAFYRQAQEGLTRVLGPKHPDTLSARLGFASVAALRGQRAQALAIIREVVEAGYPDPGGDMAKDDTLQSLHGDPEFERLVAAARKNAERKSPDSE
jgi:eukaryotic-like serine/threonine-protein kinase